MTAAVTKPYCVSAQVAMLLVNDLVGDFTLMTKPTKTQVDQYLIWISTQIDLQFSQAGYIVPLQALDAGWPEHQTHYLEMLAALGTAAMAGGHVLKPAPALNPGRSNSTGNIFQDLYNTELKKIWDGQNTTIRFQAKTYSGSAAEKSITEPIGPSLDYIVGKMNPEDVMSFYTFTELRNNIQNFVENYGLITNPLNWDDFFDLYEHKLRGYSYGSS